MDCLSFQQKSWQTFLQEGIYDVIKDARYTDDNVTIEYEFDKEKSHFNSSNFMDCLRNNQSYFYKLHCRVNVVTDNTSSMFNTDSLCVMEIPFLTDEGFIVNGNKYTFVNTMKLANGWYLEELEEDSIKKLQVSVRTARGGSFKIRLENRDLVVKATNNSGKDISISLLKFAIALTSMDIDVLHKHVGNDLASFTKLRSNYDVDDLTIDNCIRYVYSKCYNIAEENITIGRDQMLQALRFKFYGGIDLGLDGQIRFKEFISFRKRCTGLQLAEDIKLSDGKTINSGTVLTTKLLDDIDSNKDITELIVYDIDNEQTHKVIKYPYTTNMCTNMLLNVLNIFFCYMDGVGHLDAKDTLRSKVIESFSYKIGKALGKRLNEVSIELSKHVHKDLEFNIKEVDLRKFNPDFYINELKTDKFFQQADDTNSLSLFAGGFKVKSDVDASSASVQMRDIKPDQYGMICPLDTSESKEVGTNVTLASLTEINDAGFLTTPLYKVVNGKPTDELVQATAYDQLGKAVAFWNEDFNSDIVEVRLDGKRIKVPRSSVDFMESSYLQTLGLCASVIPGVENQKSKRGVMGVKMSNQAVPVFKGQRPFHSSGANIRDAGVLRVRDFIKEVIQQEDCPEKEQELVDYGIELTKLVNDVGIRTVYFKCLHPEFNREYMKPILFLQGSKSNTLKSYMLKEPKTVGVFIYRGSEIIFHKNDIDVAEYDYKYSNTEMMKGSNNEDCDFALGYNFKVLYKCLRGYTYEDAFVVSKSVVDSQVFSSVKIKSYEEELINTDEIKDTLASRDTSLNFETDLYGLPVTGSFIKGGQTLAVIKRVIHGKVKDKKDRYKVSSATEREINIPIKSDVGDDGYVISASSKNGRVVIMTATLQDLHVGDKLSGRQGNKGVIGKIVEDLDMPFCEDGTRPDILVNPLGTLARGNPGQLQDALAGLLGLLNNCVYVTPQYCRNNYDFIMNEAKKAGIEPKWYYDGRTGRKYPQKMVMGVLYLEKLNHLVESKFLATGSSYTNINAETLQPKQGKRSGGGQRLSELSNWSMTAAGGIGALQDFQTIQCTDLQTRKNINKRLLSGEIKPDLSGDNLSSMKLSAYFKAIGVNMVSNKSKGYSFEPITDEYILQHASRLNVDPNVDPFITLHDKSVFPDGDKSDLTFVSKTSRRLWGYIDLNTKVIMPWFLTNSNFLNHFYIKSIDYSESSGLSYKLERLTRDKFTELESQTAFIDVTKGIYYPNRKLLNMVNDEAKSTRIFTGPCALVKYLEEYSIEKLQELEFNTDLLYYTQEEEANLDKIGNTFAKGLDVPTKTHMECGSVPHEENDKKLSYKYQKIRTKVRYIDPKKFIVSKMLILPTAYRPHQSMRNEYHPFDKLYKNLMIKLRNSYTEQQFNTMYSYLTTIQGNVKDDKNGGKSSSLIPIGARILSSKLDKKSTVLRGEIHGFRVMNSGRSVIVGDPTLSVYEYGLPYAMALSKYRNHLIGTLKKTEDPYYKMIAPSCIGKVLDCLASSDIAGISRYIQPSMTAMLSPREVLDLCYKIDENIFNTLANRIKSEKDVINREPSLHRFNLKALTPILVRGLAIRLPPVHCPSFNADYDGDTMSSSTPNSRQGQESLANGMSVENNIINPKDNSIILNQAQDIILGLYQLTAYRNNLKSIDKWSEFTDRYYSSAKTLEYDLEIEIVQPYDIVILEHEGKLYCNTVGRLVFNSKLPNGFTNESDSTKGFYKVKYDKQVTKKLMGNINNDIIHSYSSKEFLRCLDDVKNLGLLWSDFSGFSISAFDFEYRKEAVDIIKSKAEEKEDILREYQDLHLIPSKGNSPAIISLWSDAVENIENSITYPVSVDEMEYQDIYQIVLNNSETFNKLFTELCSTEKIVIKPQDIFDAYQKCGGTGSIGNSEKGLSSIASEITSKAVELKIEYPDEYIQLINEAFLYICLRLREGLERDSAVFRLIDSGARGSFSNYSQCVGIVGQVTTASNELLESPLKGCYIDGIDIFESFNDSYFARKGIISSAILTEKSGTLTKFLITLCQDVTVDKHDCGADAYTMRLHYKDLTQECKDQILSCVANTSESLITGCSDKSIVGLHIDETTFEALAKSYTKEITIGENVIKLHKVLEDYQKDLIKGRVFQLPAQYDIEKYNIEEDMPILSTIGKTVGKYIDNSIIDIIEDSAINYISYRSTLECKCKKGVCQTCYGDYLSLNNPPELGTFIGVISAQALGEPSTQLTLDTNHGKASDTSVTGSVDKIKAFVSASVGKSGNTDYIYSLGDTFFRDFNALGIDSHLHLKSNFYIKNIELGMSSLQTIENMLADKKSKYINKFEPLTPSYRFQDLMLIDYNEGRMRLLNDYYRIYADKAIKINPKNFEIVVRQQTKFWLVTETVGDLPESAVVDYDTLRQRELVPNMFKDPVLYAYPLWCSHEDSAKFNGNALAYISSSRVRDHINDCVANKVIDDGKSFISAQTAGANLVTREIKDLELYEPLKPDDVDVQGSAFLHQKQETVGVIDGLPSESDSESFFGEDVKAVPELDVSEFNPVDMDAFDDDFNNDVDFKLAKVGGDDFDIQPNTTSKEDLGEVATDVDFSINKIDVEN